MMAVRVFQHLPEGKPAVTEHAKITVLLPALAKAPRAVKLPFEALPGALYAVTGYVYGDCEAKADGLLISIAKRQSDRDDPARSRSLFGRFKARRAAAMISNNVPQLAWPVSQGFTQDQVRETDFHRLDAQLGAIGSLPDRWEAAYILRVLEQYGRLEPGARGLALSVAPDQVATAAATAGCEMHIVHAPAGAPVAATCAAHFSTPAAGTGFDFAYVRSDLAGHPNAAWALGLIEDMLARLRPGGLAILLVNTGPQLDRHGLGRIALELAAQGHVAAQLRHGDAAEERGRFGIVVRATTENIVA